MLTRAVRAIAHRPAVAPRRTAQPVVSRQGARSNDPRCIPMLPLLVLHACCPVRAMRTGLHGPRGPVGLLASRAFWLGGLASAALWALAAGLAFG